MEVLQQPVLHVEARVKSNRDGIIVRTDLIRDEITQWLIDNFVVLSLGQEIKSFGEFTGRKTKRLLTKPRGSEGAICTSSRVDTCHRVYRR
jgi:hypothetical protein